MSDIPSEIPSEPAQADGLRALPRPVAAVVGGGGVLGAAHVGVERRRPRVGLLASSAIPGVLPPVSRDGRTLVDGGVIAYVPVRAALRVGAASVVVLSIGPESGPLPPIGPRRRAGAVAARAGVLMMHHQIERDLHEVSRHIPTVVVPTGIDEWPAPWDFGHAARMIRTASATAGRFLDGLHVRGPGLYRAGPTAVRGDKLVGAGR